MVGIRFHKGRIYLENNSASIGIFDFKFEVYLRSWAALHLVGGDWDVGPFHNIEKRFKRHSGSYISLLFIYSKNS